MSDSASFAFAPSSTLFSRLMASLDRWLLAYAEMTIRNGDIPRCEVEISGIRVGVSAPPSG